VLALAGGVAAGGADNVSILVRRSDAAKREVDLPAMVRNGSVSDNLRLESGDVIFVQRAPVFYIYGEVQRAGAYRLEPDMNVMQAVAVGGGITLRGTERGMRIRRQGADGKVVSLEARPGDRLQPNDVVYVRESLF
jgi:polysaccharide export outer membrane protein